MANKLILAQRAAVNYATTIKVPDKRLSFLSYFGDLMGDISSYHCQPSTAVTTAMLRDYSSYKMLGQAESPSIGNLQYILPGLDLSGAFTIEGELAITDYYAVHYSLIGGSYLFSMGKYSCALGTNAANQPKTNIDYSTGLYHLAVTRTSSGLMTAYRAGIRQNSVNDTTNWGVGKTLALRTNNIYMIRYLRIISGVCIGNGGDNFPVPTAPYTGYEDLG
jgi:hypothetical protein